VSLRRRLDEAGPKQATPVAREPGLGVFGWGCARPAVRRPRRSRL